MRMLLRGLCALAVLTMLLSGCGGGGGGVTTATILGYVTDSSDVNKPIPGATVALYALKSRQEAPIKSTKTDDKGYFELTTNAGRYSLRVELPDGTYQAVVIDIVASGKVEINIRLVPRDITVSRAEIDAPQGPYYVGETYQFKATAYSDSQALNLMPTWCVEGDIGTIDKDGKFTAKKAGSGKIWAIFTADVKASVDISVQVGLTKEEVTRLFPLTIGSQWIYDPYNESETKYTKVTDGSKIIEELRTETYTGNDIHTVLGTQPPNPFPVTTIVKLLYLRANYQKTFERKVNGQVVDSKTETGYGEDYDKSFATNVNGEAKQYGEQHWEPLPNIPPPYTNPDTQGTWGPIEPYPIPWLLLKDGENSWQVHVDMPEEIGDTGIKVKISFDFVAEFKGLEKVSVPYGTVDCYKVVYSAKNVKVSMVTSGIQLLSSSFEWTITRWYAIDIGVVKDEQYRKMSVSLKETSTGRTLEASGEEQSSSQLKSCNVIKP